ncbi:MAG: 50S ribosomal protein L29 [Candidatus Magasanikbacteria bacterium]|nr:50S ribosomal protein L29 [Candidatus Magasanikbacteria bacterium]
MVFADYKQKSTKELRVLLVEKRAELWRNRAEAREHQLKKVHLVSVLRKEIAQIQTLLSQVS